LLTVEGTVEILPVNSTNWIAAKPEQLLRYGDRVRTGVRSRSTVRLSDLTVLRINELTTFQVRPPAQAGRGSVVDVHSGSTYFFSRQRPAEQEFRTPLTSGAIRGTEFNLAVAEDGRTVVTLLDGSVILSNGLGQVSMNTGEQGVVDPGQAPKKTAMLQAINIIQWCLYYPGVLDATELELSDDQRHALAQSLAAYQSGDLLRAVATYPADRTPASDFERVYRAATLLSAGQVEQAESLLAQLTTNTPATERPARLATALRELVAVVKNQPGPRAIPPRLATEWLAESYYLQAHARLWEALQSARAAVDQSPNFGFGWARVAELELCFGHYNQAQAALERSLELSPRNAQSIAVKGFILLAENKVAKAETAFDKAIAVDGALANAWLGRGLCRIHNWQNKAGLDDLQVAAVLEPQRAVLRSYLGKAFSNVNDEQRARKELSLAERLDPNDPTAWLYAALVEQKDNDINQAVRDLEKSKQLNDNRRLFRSRMLLDEDQAVRSASLAHIYQDAGVINWNKDIPASDWAVREASRAVNYDYGNYSAHQFLASSYDALRDPRQINLRYETPWFSEQLMANLLSPVAAGNLSDFSAERPYSPMFEKNHFGVSSDTEYLSHGDWLERGSQYGTWDDVTYSVDTEYRSEKGWRPNNDVEQTTVTAKAKVQVTPQDSIFVEGLYYDSSFGDEAQYYYQYGTTTPSFGAGSPSPTFRGIEREEPNVFLGYHHEWAPGSHTLFLSGHLDDQLKYNTGSSATVIPFTEGFAGNSSLQPFFAMVNYKRSFDAYTAELQQIFQTEHQTFIAGGRYQYGWENTVSTVTPHFPPAQFSYQDYDTHLERYVIYGYETLKLFDQVELTGGVTYDHLDYPLNVDTSPISKAQTDTDQVSPKAGIVWTPLPKTHLRGVYTRSLGGVFYDTSVRLEPTQVAGFNQAFRSIIPESVAGLVPGSRFTTYGVGLDQSFDTGTYISITGERLESEADKNWGAVTNAGGLLVPDTPTTTSQSLGYTEKTLGVSLTQLVFDQWSLGGRYQLSYADFHGHFQDIPTAGAVAFNQNENATLQQLTLFINYYHPCGIFGQVNSLWTAQDNDGYTPAIDNADFWQFNAYIGYRFLHRAAEIRLGLLNITDRDYRLNPLNLYYDLPRGRTLAVSAKFYF
jgi:cytochrome c-type biogenesis protein CcmH/NrfG